MKARQSAIFLIIVFQALIPESVAQDVSKSKPVYGVRYTTHYFSIPSDNYSDNYKVLSSIPSAFVEFNKHFDLHIGIVYAHLMNPSRDSRFYYKPDEFGLTLGCKLNSIDHIKNLRLVGQADVSIIKVGNKTNNSHYMESDPLPKVLWTYSISLGFDYQLNRNFHIIAGCSPSITSERKIFLSDKLLSIFMGVDYRFGCTKKK